MVRKYTYSFVLTTLLEALDIPYYNKETDIVILIKYITGSSYLRFVVNVNKTLSDDQSILFYKVLSNLKRNIPITYIVGTTWFYNYRFKVTNSTLIPRSDSEILVSEAIKVLKSNNNFMEVVDIGTGSGNIIIPIVNELSQEFSFTALDSSKEAIEVAETNAKNLLTRSKQDLLHFRVFNILTTPLNKVYNLMLSNPPYVTMKNYKKLDKSIFFEPASAISDFSDGLTFYKRYNDLISTNLSKSGVLLVEIESSNINQTINVFNNPLIKSIDVIKDINQKERVLLIRKQP